MRLVSFAFITIGFAFSAQAISSECQGISPQVQKCNDGISSMTKELPIIINKLNSFTAADGIEAGLQIYNVAEPIKPLMEKASKDCCANLGSITFDDAQSVVDTVTPVLSQIVSALDIVSEKKKEFDQIIMATDIAQDMIKGFYNGVKSISTCISNTGTKHQPSFVPIINDYVSQIDGAFNNAKKVYEF